jgi:hypothetical protein
LSQQWKQSIIVPIYRKSDETGSDNYRGILLLRTTCNILSNILVSWLNPYVGEITGDHGCGFLRNGSTANQTFCIRQILEKKLGIMGTYMSYL